MKTLILIAALTLLPSYSYAEYLYAKPERTRMEQLATELELKAEQAFKDAYAASFHAGPAGQVDASYYSGVAVGYLESAKRLRDEAIRQRPLPRNPRTIWRR